MNDPEERKLQDMEEKAFNRIRYLINCATAKKKGAESKVN